MRPTILCCALALALPGLAHADARDTVKGVTSKIVSWGKDVAGGVSEGVDSGRKDTTGTDGAQVVGSHEELAQHGEVAILSLGPGPSDGTVEVVLGIANDSDQPIRLAELDDDALLLIDRDGYATRLVATADNPAELTVPAAARIKQRFVFAGKVEQAAAVRLWRHDYSVEAAAGH